MVKQTEEKIQGVKRLVLPFTEQTSNLEFYENTFVTPPTTQPKPRNPYEEAYTALTQEKKQTLSDGENLIFEVRRRARIVLERLQREAEKQNAKDQGIDVDDPNAHWFNAPFEPTPEEVNAKFLEVLTPEEKQLLTASLATKKELKDAEKAIIDEIKALEEAEKEAEKEAKKTDGN